MTHMVIHLKKNQDPKIFIERAAEIISEGLLLGIRTESIYIIGADPTNFRAVEAVFNIRNQDRNQGMPILALDIEEAKKIVEFDEFSIKIAEKIWPGPISFLLPLKNAIVQNLQQNVMKNENEPLMNENGEFDDEFFDKLTDSQIDNFYDDKINDFFVNEGNSDVPEEMISENNISINIPALEPDWNFISGGSYKVEINISSDPLIVSLLKKIKEITGRGYIIAAPATFSNDILPPFKGVKVVQNFAFALNFIIEAGNTKYKNNTTLIAVEDMENIESQKLDDNIENKIVILREGAVSTEKLISIIK
ncbi:MAG: L-threonylcarbamoyladenylate synthase [Promethearchaeota archaeon]